MQTKAVWQSYGGLGEHRVSARHYRLGKAETHWLIVHLPQPWPCFLPRCHPDPLPSAADSPPLAQQYTCGRHTCEHQAPTTQRDMCVPHPHHPALGRCPGPRLGPTLRLENWILPRALLVPRGLEPPPPLRQPRPAPSRLSPIKNSPLSWKLVTALREGGGRGQLGGAGGGSGSQEGPLSPRPLPHPPPPAMGHHKCPRVNVFTISSPARRGRGGQGEGGGSEEEEIRLDLRLRGFPWDPRAVRGDRQL